MADISMTYDLLFDILRIEKSRDDLQKLEDDFYDNVVDYIQSKEAVINNPSTPHGEREITRIQLGNVKKLLVELYDRREKKIINLSIYRIKTGSSSITTASLLKEEKQIFESVHDKLSNYRKAILYNIIEGKPVQSVNEKAVSVQFSGGEEKKSLNTSEDLSTGIKSVRFIKPVPKFLGPELETYGPFEENDIASLPAKIANILVKKSRAENMDV